VSKTREPTRLTGIDKIRLTVFTQPRAKRKIVVRANRTVSEVAAKTPPSISRCQGCEDRHDATQRSPLKVFNQQVILCLSCRRQAFEAHIDIPIAEYVHLASSKSDGRFA
jgi:hypothetical protein